jgi:phenylacetate-CoA ligase
MDSTMPMNENHQPTPETIDQIRDIPIYRKAVTRRVFPILEKTDIARGFPDNWMTPRLAEALANGKAEFVLSTGTHHARMQIIRPPYFLLHSYYRLWSEHPDIAWTWRANCRRVSLTTVLATDHVVRTHARNKGEPLAGTPDMAARRLDARTMYVNLTLDPALWERHDVERMIGEIDLVRKAHPDGHYHLDCSSYYLAHLIRKARAWGLWESFPQPASIIHAYEYSPENIRRFLRRHVDCPVVDLFGSTELGYLYYSDRHGSYVPYHDQMHLELIPLFPGSSTYSIIVTSTRNPYMPLIRYRSGDCAQTLDGSADPARIARFCGREKEMLRLADGIVSQADLDDWIAATAPTVFLYQLHMIGERHAQLLYTSFDDRPLATAQAVTLQQTVFAACGVDIVPVHRTHIAIGNSGKYRWLTGAGTAANGASHGA